MAKINKFVKIKPRKLKKINRNSWAINS